MPSERVEGMHFADLVEEVSQSSGVPRNKVEQILHAFQDITKGEVRKGGRVVMPKFGTFFAVELKPRELFGGSRRVVRSSSIRFRESRRG